MVWERMGGIVMPDRESIGVLFEIWGLKNIDDAWENAPKFLESSAEALMISVDEFKQAILGYETILHLYKLRFEALGFDSGALFRGGNAFWYMDGWNQDRYQKIFEP